jgi:uroporphyrinogen-III synthase
VEPAATGPLEAALREVASFDWIVFASRHAVAAVTGIVPTAPAGIRVAAVGQATAQVLRQRGWPVDLLPSEANAAGLVAAFQEAAAAGDVGRVLDGSVTRGNERAGGSHRSGGQLTTGARYNAGIQHAAPGQLGAPDEPGAAGDQSASLRPLHGLRILFPASSRALPTIAVGLTQLGAEVVQVEAYRTESSTALDVDDCRSWIARGGIGAVTFASPSAVGELEHALGKQDFDRLLSSAAAVAIGPTTARALTDRGHTPTLAESATLQGLAQTTHRLLQTSEADGPAPMEKL